MSEVPIAALTRLIRRVQRALWLDEVARVQRAGLWTAAAILTIGALSRWHYRMPTRLVLAGLVLAPILLALAVGLARRPRWETALLAADRRAGADALLLTAYGLPRSPTGAGALVLQQAQRALSHWEQQVRDVSPRAALPWAPIVIMLAAAPLLALQPAGGTLPAEAPRARTATPTPTAPLQPELQALIAELRKAGARDAQPAPGRTTQPRRPLGQTETLTRFVPPDRHGSAIERSERGAEGPRARGMSQGRNELEGARPTPAAASDVGGRGGPGRDMAGTGSAHPTPISAAVPEGASQRAIPLMRQGAPTDARTAMSGALAPAATDPAPSAGATVPPAMLVGQAPADHLAFTPAQRQLIARYFARLGEEEAR